jgi:hypothetical protein
MDPIVENFLHKNRMSLPPRFFLSRFGAPLGTRVRGIKKTQKAFNKNSMLKTNYQKSTQNKRFPHFF